MSHKIIQRALIVFVVGTLMGCSSIKQGLRWMGMDTSINDAELKELISSGTRMSLNWATGDSGSITYYADGTTAMNSNGKSNSGVWQIKENRLCLNWRPADSESEHCYTVYRSQQDSLKLYDEQGSYYAEATIPGVSS
ncbi:MAG: hypothetical protein ABFS45_24600 [Pseudomonadota bacterium]